MIGGRRAAFPACALRRRALALPLLVVALLAGLLAMHGLGTAPPPEAHPPPHSAVPHSAPASAHAAHGGHATHVTHATSRAGDGGRAAQAHSHDSRPAPEHQHAGDCECDGTDGHAAHADATCAASGVSGAPAVDAPAAEAAPGPQPATGLEGCWSRTGGERAPPSLHRLQLLRI